MNTQMRMIAGQRKPATACIRTRRAVDVKAAKNVMFNTDMEALKKMQKGADKLATVVGVTIGPKGRNVVLETKFGSPKIVNDGVTIAREVELEDSVENMGAKLVQQAAARTNDLAGDGTTTATVLSAALINEGLKIVAAGANPVQLARGMEKTVAALVNELKKMSVDIQSDKDLANVAAVSAGNNPEIGKLISDAMAKVGRQGVVTMEESRTAEDVLVYVEGMQFERGFFSPYFVTDPERMIAEYENCRILLVDKKISSAREIVHLLEAGIKGNYPILIVCEDMEQEALATLVVNKLRGNLKVVAVKAPGFGERKTSYMDDVAVLTGATLVKDELGISVDKATEEVFGLASKVSVTKDNCVIVGAGTTQADVAARVKALKLQLEKTDLEFEQEKIAERIAKLSGGVAVIQVGAQTETELREKKLRVEDALNATKAAIAEGIVVGGGCTLVRLAAKVEAIKATLDNDEQRIGADIVKKALAYPLRLIANNAGVNGSVVMSKVLAKDNKHYGFNAATGKYEDLMESGILDPTKVVRCCLENACSVAKTFLLADVVVTNLPEDAPAPGATTGGDFGY